LGIGAAWALAPAHPALLAVIGGVDEALSARRAGSAEG
jgi:hypothetical protein